MNDFLKRVSSRKFLSALAVQIASVVALFSPERANEFNDAAVRIAALLTLLLAGLGYGKVEGYLDQQAQKKTSEPKSEL